MKASPIRERRIKQGMSQAQLAAAAGLSVHTIYLSEKYDPSERVALLLATALACNPSDLTKEHP